MDANDRAALDGLLGHRARFVSFVSARLRDRAAAEDIVQAALAKALQAPAALKGADLSRWFYRVLRNAIVDHHRRGSAQLRALERLRDDPTSVPLPDSSRRICRCVRAAFASLEPKQRRIIEGVELQGLAPAAFAAAEGISSGNAAVRLHRARRMMAERLKGICGTCSLDACSDCDCGHQQGPTL